MSENENRKPQGILLVVVFKRKTLVCCTIARRLNKQCPCYVSWRADPEAHAIDAFSPSLAKSHLLRVPCSRPLSSSPAEGEKGLEHRRDHRACLANSSVVAGVAEDADQGASAFEIHRDTADPSQPPENVTLTAVLADTAGMQDICQRHLQQGGSHNQLFQASNKETLQHLH